MVASWRFILRLQKCCKSRWREPDNARFQRHRATVRRIFSSGMRPVTHNFLGGHTRKEVAFGLWWAGRSSFNCEMQSIHLRRHSRKKANGSALMILSVGRGTLRANATSAHCHLYRFIEKFIPLPGIDLLVIRHIP